MTHLHFFQPTRKFLPDLGHLDMKRGDDALMLISGLVKLGFKFVERQFLERELSFV